MAHIDSVATLFDELDNMETEFGLDNLAHLLGVVEIERHRRKLRVEGTLAAESELTAAHTAAGVFGIQNGKCGKLALAFCHAVRIVSQTRFYILNLLTRHNRIYCDNLRLYLKRYERHTVGRQVLEIFSDIVGGRCNV